MSGPGSGAAGQGKSSRGAIAAVLLGVFLAGMAARGLFWSGPASNTRAAARAGSGTSPGQLGPGPAAFDTGIPVGFARSDEGARAAAVSYVLTGQALLDLAPTRVPDAVRVFAASASADSQVSDAEEQLRQLRVVLADGTGPIRFVQAVLASRVDAYTRARARVLVWSVGVLARVGAAQPQAGWTISTFELVWERGDWKVWSETISPGPAPVLNGGARPASNAEFDRALNAFVPWQRSSGVAP